MSEEVNTANWPNPERHGAPPMSRAMRTRDEQIEPWGFIFPFAKNSLQDREMCNLTVTRNSTVSATMPLYTDEQLREAERRAEQRVRAEIARDSERLYWLEKLPLADIYRYGHGWKIGINRVSFSEGKQTLRETIDAAREVW